MTQLFWTTSEVWATVDTVRKISDADVVRNKSFLFQSGRS